ncbi:hypothetical protein [Tessaracoccus defluvii]|uniref:Uncharacterized protein n=1 Tax=Tessaracoccus defluvii TaxID=1285901 RepID=A0A7H0H7U9_9ACTN|nr:hypothetical protein [Tessaracoccus defluvii]QNP56615.1 hypothetical protein H9L22_04180 [Tessaracoccus defluvii]
MVSIDITKITCPISRHDDPEAAAQWAGLVALYTDHGEDTVMTAGRIEANLDNADAFEDEASEIHDAAKSAANDVISDALHSQAAALYLHARFLRTIAAAAGIYATGQDN